MTQKLTSLKLLKMEREFKEGDHVLAVNDLNHKHDAFGRQLLEKPHSWKIFAPWPTEG